MPKEEVTQVQCAAEAAAGICAPSGAAFYWTVEEDHGAAEAEELRSHHRRSRRGPKRTSRSSPAFLFSRPNMDFRDGRREAFVEWLTAPANPLFARVAVNRDLGMAFRRGAAAGHQRFRPAGRQAVQSETAGLPGFGIRRAQLQHEVAAPADRDLGHLPALVEGGAARSSSRESEDRRAQHLSLALPPAAPGGGADLGFHPLRMPDDLDLSVGGKSFQLSDAGSKAEESSCRKTAASMRAPTAAASTWCAATFRART